MWQRRFLVPVRQSGQCFDEGFGAYNAVHSGGENAAGVAGSLPAGIEAPKGGGLHIRIPQDANRRGAAGFRGGHHRVGIVIAMKLLSQGRNGLLQYLRQAGGQKFVELAGGDARQIAGPNFPPGGCGAAGEEVSDPLGRGVIIAAPGAKGGLLDGLLSFNV